MASISFSLAIVHYYAVEEQQHVPVSRTQTILKLILFTMK